VNVRTFVPRSVKAVEGVMLSSRGSLGRHVGAERAGAGGRWLTALLAATVAVVMSATVAPAFAGSNGARAAAPASAAVRDAVAAVPISPTDPTKVPHYFGPYPNWANSPQGLPDAIVTISGGGGTGAEATASVNAKTGGLTGIAVTKPGTGFTAAPSVVISSPGLVPTAPAAATAVISSGVVTSVAVIAAGFGFTQPTVAFAGGTPTTPATAVASGGVNTLAITAGGSGYKVQPIVELSLPDAAYCRPVAPALTTCVVATATATMNTAGVVDSITPVNPGSGYLKPPTVTIRDGQTINPTAGTAVATIDIGRIDVVAPGGAGYVSAPTVTITDSVAPFDKGATAVATVAAAGALTSVTVTAPGAGYITPGLKKFVDTLAGLGPNAANNLGQYIPVAVPDTTTYPGADYYEIAVVQYRQKFASSLPATLLRGYVQLSTPVVPGNKVALSNANVNSAVPNTPITGFTGVDGPHYLGPTIVATKDRPVRVLFRNLLPTGVAGDLFLPVDTSIMGSGAGNKMMTLGAGNVPDEMVTNTGALGTVTDGIRNPMCGETPKPVDSSGNGTCYSENRATLHLHGGVTPWISDGTPHQWVTPAGEKTDYPAGVSVSNVPDMPDPGPGAETFFYTNQQSARLMFYHDHAWGITRLNVYAGEAAPYLLTDATEQKLIGAGGALETVGTGTPLVIQDKTFVPSPATMAKADPTWNYAKWGGEGSLWTPHVYMPAQNPAAPSGANPLGRWFYGPWFWPPATNAKYPPIANPYYDPLCNPDTATFCEPPTIPSTPNVSVGMEAFDDTPIVNGTAYPTTTVDPKAYRYRILNAANDRSWNLSWYVADPTTGTLSEVALKPAEVAAAQTDPNVFPTPDLTKSPAGPDWIQVGSEGGFLPAPAVIPAHETTWIIDPTRFDFGNVDQHSLVVAPAERADVVVDFSQYQGKTLILYNDAPAAYPGRISTYDYYTGGPDLTSMGGAPTTLAGYGPNTRTIMQVKVANTKPAVAFDVPNTTADRMGALVTAFAHHLDSNNQPAGVFESGSDPIIVGQAAYNSAYGTSFVKNGYCTDIFHPTAKCDGYARIQQQGGTPQQGGDSFKFDTLSGNQLSIPLQPKGIHDETNSASFDEWGRLSSNMGLEAPGITPLTQNIILYPYVNPATEVLDATGLPSSLHVTPISSATDGTQIWKITHNGVDTHAMHVHLYNLQVINRVTWDNIIIPPDPNELGWKETVRVSPLEDTYVAVRPIVPTIPFGVPDSVRLLNPMMPLGAMGKVGGTLNGTEAGFNNTDALGNPTSVPIANDMTNFGWEYVWHCHLLSHEEMDMMRPVTVHVARVLPAVPVVTSTTVGAVTLSWADGTPVNYAVPTSWTNPGTAEIGYRIERAPVDAGGNVGTYAVVQKHVLANTTTYTDYTVPAAGTSFSYVVVAYNAAGDSPSNPTVAAPSLPAVVPVAPLVGTAVAHDTSATVVWTPQADGGSPIMSYSVMAVDPVTLIQIGAEQTVSGPLASSLLFTGLTNGTPVAFVVRAINLVGPSIFSAVSNTVTPVGLPAAPLIGTATAGIASATVNWTAPANGGSPITGYSVRVIDVATSAQIGALLPAAAGATSLLVTGLVSGTVVAFQVAAINAVGTGPFSALSNTVTPFTVPAAPVIGTATPGEAMATVTWTAPADGGSPITSYAVRVVDVATGTPLGSLQSAAAGATSLVVTGLVNGTAVAFQVEAINVVGTSPFSALSNSVVPGANFRFVIRAYGDLFNRIPDPAGLASWVTALQSGTPRIAVANSLTSSAEYRSALIAASYQTYLGRLPDPGGAASWLNYLNSGNSITQMEASFLASPEYYIKSGSTDSGWVTALYLAVLGRAAATSETQYWVGQLTAGASYAQVATGFLLSTEHLNTVVNGYYLKFLRRAADPAGLAGWVSAMQAGTRHEVIIGSIIASGEYYLLLP
jgi:FtsP/CotA-like multicopper oxidase with cupredoxin domain